MSDVLSRALDDLPHADPDPRRTARVRSRCHAVLARHAGRSAARRPARRLWEPFVVGLGGVYVAVILAQTLLLYGF